MNQVNNANPISQLSNTIRSWLFERNYAKFYEAWYARFNFSKDVGNGVTIFGGLKYEDRIPLENTSHYSFGNRKGIEFTPNYPVEVVSGNFQAHQALIRAPRAKEEGPSFTNVTAPTGRLWVTPNVPIDAERCPAIRHSCRVSSTVEVLPLVPVTATMVSG